MEYCVTDAAKVYDSGLFSATTTSSSMETPSHRLGDVGQPKRPMELHRPGRILQRASGIALVQAETVCPCNATSPFSFVSISAPDRASKTLCLVDLTSCVRHPWYGYNYVNSTDLQFFSLQQCNLAHRMQPLPHCVWSQPMCPFHRRLAQW